MVNGVVYRGITVVSPTTSSLILKSTRQRLMSVDGLAYKRTYKSRVITIGSTL